MRSIYKMVDESCLQITVVNSVVKFDTLGGYVFLCFLGCVLLGVIISLLIARCILRELEVNLQSFNFIYYQQLIWTYFILLVDMASKQVRLNRSRLFRWKNTCKAISIHIISSNAFVYILYSWHLEFCLLIIVQVSQSTFYN